jgi:AraC-like DNA-binding protein
MFTDDILVLINVACIACLVILLVILVAATRMKGGAGWAALISVTTTVPTYLANLTRDLDSDTIMLYLYPALLSNALCIPALWFFTRRQTDKSFRLTARSLLHAIPALVSLLITIIYYVPLSSAQVEAERAFMEAGGENLPAIINDVIVFGQFVAYFTAILLYIRKRKRYLQDNYSDSDYMEIKWTFSFIKLFFILFLVVFVSYVINPRTDTWLIPVLNVLGLGYLAYVVVSHSTQAYLNRLPEVSVDAPERDNGSGSATPAISGEQMREISGKVVDYLRTSKAYTNPEFSTSMLSVETGVSPKNISRSINGYLNKNFYDLVNEMRVEEAKRLLVELNSGYTIDSVHTICGFRSRTSFYRTFGRFTGTTPSQWMKMNGLKPDK